MKPGYALVTGGAQRLGRAMSLALAQDGWAVAIHYNSSDEQANALAEEISAAGGTAVTVQADLLDVDATASLVARASSALGQPLTLLINNASIFEYDNFATATMESWERHVGSNVRAPFQLTQAFAAQAPEAVADSNGEPVAQAAVVNMCDMRVRKLTPEFTTYTIAKSALWTLTQTAAQGLAPHVRVNAIGPGPTMQGTRQSDAHWDNQRAATILNRGSDPQEIVAALRFMLSVDGFTGQLLCMDGGQHLAWKTPDVQGVE
ncbi:NAD(P)-dependent dehydrogenase, short-chain alcohol dehydrogenase family [Monaibacterium marinum]|uniref:NAD(P)-dependent dehydrogenase, short-chain alcohol dehydrogenase family n=1 Tax=Pontivivens marinum TaxID=1690039 RepID=A0A2C9CQQ1_9RHOB|nr:SDR family oxidoreductase [Monaibacterium marinum]SOH92709.1 NAD(P)-dependent dehydrogenase, short-chain alcohol dehydrogenase family [Monaibacterium marinum]